MVIAVLVTPRGAPAVPNPKPIMKGMRTGTAGFSLNMEAGRAWACVYLCFPATGLSGLS